MAKLTPQEGCSTKILDVSHLGGCGLFYIYGPRYFPEQMWDPPVTNSSLLIIGFTYFGYLPCTSGI